MSNEQKNRMQLEKQWYEEALRRANIMVFDQDTGLRYTRIFNSHPGLDETVLGKTDEELLPSNDSANLRAIKESVMKTGKPLTTDVKTTIGGDAYYYALTINPLYDQSGVISGVACTSIDITALKKTEIALKEANKRIQGFLESIPDAFISINRDWRFAYVNAKAEHIIGRSREEVIGKDIRSVCDRGDKALDQYQRAFEKQEPEIFEEYVNHLHAWFDTRIYSSPDGLSIYFRDITRRKLAKEALLESEDRFKIAQKAGRVGVFDWDMLTNECIWSEELKEIYGLDADYEENGNIWFAFVHPEDISKAQEMINRVVEEKQQEIDREYRIIRPDRQEHWLLANGQIKYDFSGRPVRMLCAIIDITRLKQAEQTLKESEKRYRTLFESIDEGYCVIEMRIERGKPLDYRFIEINQAFERQSTLFGAKGRWMRELRPEHEEYWFEIYRDVALTGKAIRFEQGGKQLGDRWFSLYAFRIGAPAQHRVAVLFNDITERKRTEDALSLALSQAEESKNILDALMEYIPIGITIADATDVKIRMVSKYGRNLLGKTNEEVLGIPAPEHPSKWGIYHSDGKALASPEELPLTRATLKREIVKNEEWVVTRKDGTLVPILCNAAPIFDKKGKVLGGVIGWQDFTEQRRSHEALQNSENRLKIVNENLENIVVQRTEQVRALSKALSLAEQRERKRFSYILHENLQQLLFCVKMVLSQYLRDHEKKTGNEEYDDIAESLAILNKALQTTKILAIELNPPVLRREGLDAALGWLANHMHKTYGLAVDLKIHESIDFIRDETQLMLIHMTRELLNNVVQHAGVLSSRVDVTCESKRVQIIVSDSGRGFKPQDVLSKETGEESRLGLFSIRERLKLFGGELTTESTIGQGTRITISLPYDKC